MDPGGEARDGKRDEHARPRTACPVPRRLHSGAGGAGLSARECGRPGFGALPRGLKPGCCSHLGQSAGDRQPSRYWGDLEPRLAPDGTLTSFRPTARESWEPRRVRRSTSSVGRSRRPEARRCCTRRRACPGNRAAFQAGRLGRPNLLVQPIDDLPVLGFPHAPISSRAPSEPMPRRCGEQGEGALKVLDPCLAGGPRLTERALGAFDCHQIGVWLL